jgi:ribonuclease D
MTTENNRPGFDLKMTAEEINRLPIAAYEGAVHVVTAQDSLDEAVRALRREAVLGFDTETKPNFKRGENNPLSLVQLAGSRAVYIMQLRHLPSWEPLFELFSDERIIKAGVDIPQDIAKLQERIGGDYKSCVDVSLIAKQAGLKNFSLRGLAAILLGVRIAKGMRVSNWARDMLLPAQIKYAATDAWISRELYLRLEQSEAGGISKDPSQSSSEIASPP